MRSVVLLIDKRLELSTKYKKVIENINFSVIVSKDLISAMKTIQEVEPDLILISDSVDEDLPDFCKKIRTLTYNMRPVIIAISKSANIDDKLKVLENGADDFISEPVNIEEFIMRIKAHIRREKESNMEDFLPNKNYSLRALKRVIKSSKDWASMLIGINNLENYKQVYSELASNKLIQTFCAIIQSTISETDYFGKISDDEFLIITDRFKTEKLAKFLIFAFETIFPKFYSPQDLSRGYMIMQGDEYAGRKSDFVNTTIGIVTNEFQMFENVAELINSLVQTKNLAYLPSKSTYLIDCPRLSAENSIVEKQYNKKIFISESDESLLLLLKTILDLQGFEVVEQDENPAIMVIDAGDIVKQEGLKLCKKIKENEKYNATKLIVTSNFHDKETILNCGADLYLPKPYEISNLIKWIEKFIREFNR